MAPKLAIVFDDPNYYAPGQTLTGHVQITTKRKVSGKGLNVKFEGLAYVYLKNKKKNYSATSPNHVNDTSAREDYYSNEFKIWGDGQTSQTLSAGVHRFNFSFIIPQNVPSSFEAKHGHVRHICTATLDVPLIVFKNPSCSSFYSVVSMLDLNLQEFAKKPIEESANKKMGLWFNKNDHISVKLNISHSGYVPGDNIVIDATCTNNSSRVIKETRAEVHQTTYYKVGGRSKISKHLAFETFRKFPEGQKEDSWSGDTLQIPPRFIFSNLYLCSLIDVSFTFRFKVVPAEGRLKLELSAPLILGTVPLVQYRQEALSPPSAEGSSEEPQKIPPCPMEKGGASGAKGDPSAPPENFDYTIPTQTPIYPNLPPPSYEESVIGSKESPLP